MRDRLIGLIKQKSCVYAPCDGECGGCKNVEMYDDSIESITDFLLANGVIVPPCKVGDVVWLVYTPKYPANPADKGKWFMTQDGVQRIIYGAKGLSIETWNMGTIPEKEIGKKLFFTKEEAERALKGGD